LDADLHPKSVGIFFEGGQANVFGVVLNSRDGRFLGPEFAGDSFLGYSCLLTGLSQHDTELEGAISRLKVFREFWVLLFAAFDIFLNIAHDIPLLCK